MRNPLIRGGQGHDRHEVEFGAMVAFALLFFTAGALVAIALLGGAA